MILRWKVYEFLEANGKVTSALWKVSGSSRTTAYAIAQGAMKGGEFDTLGKVRRGRQTRIGRQVELADILDVNCT